MCATNGLLSSECTGQGYRGIRGKKTERIERKVVRPPLRTEMRRLHRLGLCGEVFRGRGGNKEAAGSDARGSMQPQNQKGRDGVELFEGGIAASWIH